MELCEGSPQATDTPELLQASLSQGAALKALQRDASPEATEIISRHTLVGWLDDHRIFIQCDTALLLVNIRDLTKEWLKIVVTFGGYTTTATAAPYSLQECLETFLQTNPQAPDVDPERLVMEIAEMMQTDRTIWQSLAGIRIDNAALVGLPSLPGFAALGDGLALVGQLLFRLAVDCDLKADDVFFTICSALCDYFLTSISWSDHRWVEHTLLPVLRKPPIPYPGTLLRNGTLLKAATTHDLYRVFERC